MSDVTLFLDKAHRAKRRALLRILTSVRAHEIDIDEAADLIVEDWGPPMQADERGGLEVRLPIQQQVRRLRGQ